MATMTQTFQSKWGFHPVSRETSKKLRFLNTVYMKAQHRAKAWDRWDRKAPQNRVHVPRIRNEQRQVIGYGEPQPWNEPALCPLFSKLTTKRTNWHPTKGYFGQGVEYTFVETDVALGNDIRVAARQARKPVATAEEVQPLSLTVEEIDALYEKAVAWMESV